MAELEFVQTTFSAGEMTPRVHGRLDIEKYFSGVNTLQNFTVMRHGGAMKRAGSVHVSAVKDAATNSRLIPFAFSTTQTYALEFGDLYIRFFTAEAQLFATDVTAAITNGLFTSDITGWSDISAGTGAISHDATNLRLQLDAGGTGATNQAAAEQDVTITETTTNHYLRFSVFGEQDLSVIVQMGSATTLADVYGPISFSPGHHLIKFDPDSNANVFVQFISTQDAEFDMQIDNVEILDNVPLELVSPYATDELAEIKYTQSADILFVGSPFDKPMELQRFAADEWSLVEHDYMNGPWMPEVLDTLNIVTPSAAAGNAVTVTANNTLGINADAGFKVTDIGRLIAIDNGATWGWARITQFTSTTVVGARVLDDFAGVGASTAFRLGSWSDTTGWPEVPAFHEERLAWGRSTTEPQVVWFSRSENFNDHQAFDEDDTVVDSHGFRIQLATDQVNAIHWMVSVAPGLLVGTSGAEFLVKRAATTSALSPTNREAVRQTNRGSKGTVDPVKIGHQVMFIQRGGKVLREAAFDFNVDGVVASDVSLLSEHLLRAGIAEIAYQQNDESVVWLVTDTGTLLSFTFEKEQEMSAWSQHVIGGTDALVKSVITIAQGGFDQVWLLVERTINGATVRHVEFLARPYLAGDLIESAMYSDAGITITPSGTTISGLSHLEGQTVKVLLDGATHPDVVVASGAATLDRTGTTAQVGLAYTALIESLSIDSGTEGTTTRGKTKRMFRAFVQLLDTVGGLVGTDQGDLQELQFREPADLMDTAIPPFSGFFRVPVPSRHTDEQRVIFSHTDPLPATVLTIVVELDIGRS